MKVDFGEMNDFLNSFTFDIKLEEYDNTIYVVDTETEVAEVFSLETILTYYSLYLERLNNKKVFVFYGFQRGNRNHFYGYKRNKLNTVEILGEILPVTYIMVTKGLPEFCRESNIIKMLDFFENDSAETEFVVHHRVFESILSPYEAQLTEKDITGDIVTIRADIVETAKDIVATVVNNIKYLILNNLNHRKILQKGA